MKIHVISMLRSQERRQRMSEQMASYGIDFEFFDAVDGQHDHPLFGDYDYKKCLWLTCGKMPTRGEMGCYASHYLLWMHCITINQPIVVLEDDVVIEPFFKRTISAIENDVVKLGFIRLESHIRGKKQEVFKRDESKIFIMEDNFGGTRGYAIAPSAAAKLIKHRWSLPVDCFIGLPYLHGMSSFVIEPSVIAHETDIPTTVQLGMSKTAWYRKPTREIYALYKKIRIKLTYILASKKTGSL